ncbi:MAG: hypothetical protein KC503_17435 [Myxococcales bacterium]|nr:hypothetical protein [Myxococcales bacterium]
MTSFPYDTKATTFAEGSPVPPATLNAIQDAGIDVVGAHTTRGHLGHAIFADNSGAIGWALDVSNPESGAKCLSGLAGDVAIPIPARQGSRINTIKVKVYTVTSSQPVATLYKKTAYLDTAATAPSLGSAVGDDTAASGSDNWQVLTIQPGVVGGSGTATYSELGNDEEFVLHIDTFSTNDRIAAIEVLWDRYLTATTEITV